MSWLPSPKDLATIFEQINISPTAITITVACILICSLYKTLLRGGYDEKSWKMMAGNRVIFSASGVPNLLEIGSNQFFFLFVFSSGHSWSHIMTCAGSNYVIRDFTTATTDGAIIQFVLIKWCGVYSSQGLLWNVHCIATVVLRKQFNFKSMVIRSERSSCFS